MRRKGYNLLDAHFGEGHIFLVQDLTIAVLLFIFSSILVMSVQISMIGYENAPFKMYD